MRPAHARHVHVLVSLMREFYAETGHELDEGSARSAFEALLHDPRLGRVWLVDQGPDTDVAGGSTGPSRMAPVGPVAGYIVVTFVFAMGHGGQVAVIDDFFVQKAMRGEGLATAALADARRACAALGMRAMRVEVGRDNAVARAVYRGAGFCDVDHAIMEATLVPVSGQ